MDLISRIAQANGRLKNGGVWVRIEAKGGRLYLRATLPPRLGSQKNGSYQQRIALGYGINPNNLSNAEKEARLVGSLLDRGEFSWERYVDTETPEIVEQWVERFTQSHQSKVSKTTWRTEYQQVFKRLPLDQPLTTEVLLRAIEATEPDSRQRKRFFTTLSSLSKFAGLELDVSCLEGVYSPKAVSPANFPVTKLNPHRPPPPTLSQ
jgi:hypothetical protein